MRALVGRLPGVDACVDVTLRATGERLAALHAYELEYSLVRDLLVVREVALVAVGARALVARVDRGARVTAQVYEHVVLVGERLVALGAHCWDVLLVVWTLFFLFFRFFLTAVFIFVVLFQFIDCVSRDTTASAHACLFL